jgi:amylosucrase
VKNIDWMACHNRSVVGYERFIGDKRVYFIFNFSAQEQDLTWFAFERNGRRPTKLKDLWSGKNFQVGPDEEHLRCRAYEFFILS